MIKLSTNYETQYRQLLYLNLSTLFPSSSLSLSLSVCGEDKPLADKQKFPLAGSDWHYQHCRRSIFGVFSLDHFPDLTLFYGALIRAF
ncbi:hypothetical protein Pfo_010477 [Paulownia fortunei]|nr:hypothetical protein Pfo_010477 [Paulownia fortunei]